MIQNYKAFSVESVPYRSKSTGQIKYHKAIVKLYELQVDKIPLIQSVVEAPPDVYYEKVSSDEQNGPHLTCPSTQKPPIYCP
jgi:hypothetical protein